MHAVIGRYKEFIGGGLILAIGAAVIVQSSNYRLGKLSNMGPGFFPAALGVILVVLGLIMLIMATRVWPASGETNNHAEWRGWLCICGSLLAFIILGIYAGLVPATIAVVAISAFGDRQATFKGVAVMTAVTTAVAVVVFWWALKMQFPLIR